MSAEQQYLAACPGPCRQATLHTTIRPVVRGRIFLLCRVCGTVHSIPKPVAARS
jgi:hypothetical protein